MLSTPGMWSIHKLISYLISKSQMWFIINCRSGRAKRERIFINIHLTGSLSVKTWTFFAVNLYFNVQEKLQQERHWIPLNSCWILVEFLNSLEFLFFLISRFVNIEFFEFHLCVQKPRIHFSCKNSLIGIQVFLRIQIIFYEFSFAKSVYFKNSPKLIIEFLLIYLDFSGVFWILISCTRIQVNHIRNSVNVKQWNLNSYICFEFWIFFFWCKLNSQYFVF